MSGELVELEPSAPRAQSLGEKVKILVACLLFGVLGFSAGRFFGPERVEYVEKREEKKATSSNTKKAIARTTYKKTTITPDAGTVIEESTREEEKTERAAVATSEIKLDTRAQTVARPDWRVGVLVGATWKEPALKLGDTPLVIGVTAERRIIGGVSVGAWGTTQGAAGGVVSVEF